MKTALDYIINKPRVNGHYTVGSERFDHKITALVRATETGQHPEWHFHKEIYNQLPWTTDSTLTLSEVYQQRARQLRDKYDYLVLAFSGGSDSWTALNAFKESGTHLDEVYVSWPFRATSDYKVTTSDNPVNILSEWELTIRGMLTDIEIAMPKTKIVLVDWTDNLDTVKFDQDYALKVDDHINPGWGLRIPRISEGQQACIDRGKSVAVMFGIDKPQIMYHNNSVFCYFLDIIANMRHMPGNDGRDIELFYWTPDVPEIVHTQARLIYRWLKQNPQHLDLIKAGKPFNPANKSKWDKLVRTIIYPDYCKLQTFQAGKPHSLVYSPYDMFMFKLLNLELMKSWEYEMHNIFATVDKKFHEVRNGEITGFKGFVSGVYNLGNIDEDTSILHAA